MPNNNNKEEHLLHLSATRQLALSPTFVSPSASPWTLPPSLPRPPAFPLTAVLRALSTIVSLLPPHLFFFASAVSFASLAAHPSPILSPSAPYTTLHRARSAHTLSLCLTLPTSPSPPCAPLPREITSTGSLGSATLLALPLFSILVPLWLSCLPCSHAAQLPPPTLQPTRRPSVLYIARSFVSQGKRSIFAALRLEATEARTSPSSCATTTTTGGIVFRFSFLASRSFEFAWLLAAAHVPPSPSPSARVCAFWLRRQLRCSARPRTLRTSAHLSRLAATEHVVSVKRASQSRPTAR